MPDLIKVMISSRCNSPIELGGKTKKLSDLREELKKTVEAWKFIDTRPFDGKPASKKLIDEQLFDKQIFEVWINEDSPPKPSDRTATEECLRQVSRAHILIVLYNGDAGWALADRDVGICHQELARAWNTEPAKIRLIELPLCEPSVSKLPRNQRFQKYVSRINPFWRTAKDGDEAKKVVLEALYEAVINMVKLGKRETARGGFAIGDPLGWSLKDFAGRKVAMEEVMQDYLETMAYPVPNCPKCGLFIKIMGGIGAQQPIAHAVLSLFHAIPSSMSIAAAREMVGRPFYRDYEYSPYLTGEKNEIEAIGPIHFIGCHKSVTETQVRNLVGHPDIVLISGPFGVYMVDTVQHTQIVFLSECRDETSTRNALGRFFGWLDQVDIVPMLIENADKRKKIVSVIKAAYP